MLSLRQGLGLEVISGGGGNWQPNSEPCLEAWWKNGVGVTTFNVAGYGDWVTSWADSSSNSYDMVNTEAVTPATGTTQPQWIGGGLNIVNFEVHMETYLKSASSISLSGEFTIVVKIVPSSSPPNGKFLSYDSLNSYFEYTSTSQIKFKLASGDTPQDLDLNGGTTFGDDYLIITRNSSDLVTLWRNGVEQTASVTSTSALTLNGLGYNSGETFSGNIEEVQMYSCSNATLTSNANAYASNI